MIPPPPTPARGRGAKAPSPRPWGAAALALALGCPPSDFDEQPRGDDDAAFDDDDASSDDDSGPGDDDTVIEGCAGGPRWDRLSTEIGLHAVQGLGTTTQLDGQMGGGIAVADFDGDGILDAFAGNQAGPSALYRGRADGTFEDVAAAAGVDVPEGRVNGASSADHDGDGDMDLLVLRSGGSRLFRNRGDGTFEDVSVESGVDDGVLRRDMGGAWGDFDGDSDLDLAVASYYYPGEPAEMALGLAVGDGNRLLRSRGDGTFEDATALLPPGTLHGPSMQVAWTDLDGDSDLDLSIPNDLGAWVLPGVVFRNDGPDGEGGWNFVEVGAEAGLDVVQCSMAIAFGDADGDGDRDVIVPSMPGIVFLQATGPWQFFESTAAYGLDALATAEHDVAWNAVFEDLDNDGREDVLVQFGHMEGLVSSNFSNAEAQPDVLLWGSEGGLVPAGPPLDLADPASSRSYAVADFNGDGTPDVLTGVMGGTPRLNLSRPECTAGTWLDVAVHLPGTGNVHGVGATVTVTVGDRTLRREIDGGSRSALGSSPPVVHFGLGTAEVADRVEARLPDGTALVAEGVAAGQKWVLAAEDQGGG
ncbi:CRTAC1 family protein [Myxococcota bacterium]|nr:CRTAC1 family protein [Myxococcota bacterium]